MKIILDSLRIGYSAGRRHSQIYVPVSVSSQGSEIIALIGRNGIGKSTLLRTIAGLQRILGGDVLFDGRSISEYKKPEMARICGYISTEVIKVDNMRVCDLVALGRFPHTNWLGSMDRNDRIAVENSLQMTGLTSLRNRNITEISDGERQKAMIARVLAQDTDLIIMDEPTAFLDIAGKYEVISLLKKLAAKGKTVIFSTHDFNIAINYADKIWLFLDDRLAEGTPDDLLAAGEFEHLFRSAAVKFNSGERSFSFTDEA